MCHVAQCVDAVCCRYPLSAEILCKHEQVEELLDTYVLDLNALLFGAEELQTRITNSEEMYQLQLDTIQNRVLIAQTALSALTAGIGVGAYFGGVFGMNLIHSAAFRAAPFTFGTVFITSFACIVLIASGFIVTFRHFQILPSVVFDKEAYSTELL